MDKDYEQLQRDHEALKAQHTQWLRDFEKHEPPLRDAYSGYIQGRIDERNAKSLSPVDLVENAADLITLERAIEAAREEHKALREQMEGMKRAIEGNGAAIREVRIQLGLPIPPLAVRQKCPYCGRLKARNADDMLTGSCPRWYATHDEEAVADCEKEAKRHDILEGD